MSLFLDTSALVKLYVAEVDRWRVEAWVEDAPRIVTSLVTYVEASAAFALARRSGRLSPADHRAVLRDFDEHWNRLETVAVSETLVRHAGRLAERHGLRAYDAIQLAAALAVRPHDGAVVFGSFDDRLNRAAVRERLVLPPEPDLVADRPRLTVARRRAS